MGGYDVPVAVYTHTDGPCALALQIDQPLAALGIARGGAFRVGGLSPISLSPRYPGRLILLPVSMLIQVFQSWRSIHREG